MVLQKTGGDIVAGDVIATIPAAVRPPSKMVLACAAFAQGNPIEYVSL